MPIPALEFDYRVKDQLRVMYEHFGSAGKLGAYLRAGGREIADNTLTKWLAKYDIPIADDAYRARFAGRSTLDTACVGGLAAEVKRYLKRCKTEKTVEELCDHFAVAPKAIRGALAELEESATLIAVENDRVTLENDLQMHEAPQEIDFRKYAEVEYKIGAVADTHIGSKYERLDVNEALFDRFAAEGVRTVYHGGNMIDGECAFNKFDIYARGVEEQVANFIEKWPRREGITTHFITGDDHEGWYVQREHLNIGQKIEQDARAAGRDDLVHLGYMERDIEYVQAQGKARIRVIHAGGGSAYAHSYTSQKYAESLQGGDKPQIVLAGHFHKFNYDYPREIHIIQVGCTEDQTPFMRKKRLQAHVGGCILTVTQNELGIFTSVEVKWIPFYDRKFYEYKW